jgi:hypothetical protein
MDWTRFRAALIRGVWAAALPGLAWLAVGANLISVGVSEEYAAIASVAFGAVLYFVKKLAWPDATW